jgi:uncharacterized protein YndB with AHSA1/START domain
MKATISTTVKRSVDIVWMSYNMSKHIMNWNHASDDWFCPSAQNDLKVGGHFKYRMSARDGSFAFDFEGVYEIVNMHQELKYVMPDGRVVHTIFKPVSEGTFIETVFDLETFNSPEKQKEGWNTILTNFKLYTESL